MTIKAVFFDWGGTIAKMPMHNSWNEIDKALGCVDEMNALEGLPAQGARLSRMVQAVRRRIREAGPNREDAAGDCGQGNAA